jgi:hypothetical protein
VAASHAAFENDTVRIEGFHLLNCAAQLGKSHPLSPINLEHADENTVNLAGDGENGGEEARRVTKVGLEGRVGSGCGLPGIATRSEVEKNDRQRPDVVEHGRVRAGRRENSTLALWAHMIHAARAKLLAELVRRGETKVCDSNTAAPIEAKHVLRLEVSMIDTKGMTVLHRIEQLEEDAFDEGVVTKIATMVKDLRE